jgi:hypothetical protein
MVRMTRWLAATLALLLLAAEPLEAAVSTKIVLSVVATETATADLASPSAAVVYKKEFTWANGTGADQGDLIFSDQRTLTASATENLDLAGVLTNQFGATLTFARVNAIAVCAASANTNNVLVGGAATNAFVNWVSDATDVVAIRPGGCVVLVARDATGYAVTAGTGDILKVTNSAGSTSVVYDVLIVGRSA